MHLVFYVFLSQHISVRGAHLVANNRAEMRGLLRRSSRPTRGPSGLSGLRRGVVGGRLANVAARRAQVDRDLLRLLPQRHDPGSSLQRNEAAGRGGGDLRREPRPSHSDQYGRVFGE